MGRIRKFDYQAAIESNLIAQPGGLTLDELLERSRLEVDRSTLFRHLAHLIQSGRVERIGKARASRYRPLAAVTLGADPGPPRTQPPAVQSMPGSFEPSLPQETPFPAADEVEQRHQAGRLDLPPAENDQQNRTQPNAVPVPAPDYEAAVKKAVRTVVRDWKRCNRINLQIYLSLLVQPEHLDQVVAAVEKELAGLREDDLANFGLSPADFRGYTPAPGREAAGT